PPAPRPPGRAQPTAPPPAAADRSVVTEIDTVVEGDTYAPEIPAGSVRDVGEWQVSQTGTRYRVVVVSR
ncbi:MAG: hypothetical protein ACTMHU_09850, partial [Cellulosimicrobium funkei]